MVGLPIATLVSFGVIVVAAGCVARLAYLRLSSTHPAFLAFLLTQILTAAASNLTGPQTRAYAYLYVGFVALEWLIYGWMIREIYASIFKPYPGIAMLGLWSIYAAVIATLGACTLSFVLARPSFRLHLDTLAFVEFLTHGMTFGFVLLILMILIAISRYPLRLHRNVLVNCGLFSAILLAEATSLILNQITLRGLTGFLNLAVSLVVLCCLALWPMLLSREGQTTVVQLRHRFNPQEERRLLGQLVALNSVMLRAVKK